MPVDLILVLLRRNILAEANLTCINVWQVAVVVGVTTLNLNPSTSSSKI